MKKLSVPLYFLVLPAVFLGSCASGSSKSNQPVKKAGTPMVEGFVVKPTTITHSITVSGTVKPFEETVLMSDVSGRVVSLHIIEGKFVKQGTLLVKLFDDDLQAGLRKSIAQLALAEQTEKRNAELLKVNGISQAEYDLSTLQISLIKADMDLIRAQIRKTEIMAPFDGVLGLRAISIGAQVTPGTALATIRSTDRLKLDFSVPEKYGNLIKPGLKVTLNVQGENALSDALVMATEEAIESSTRNLRVRAVIQNNIATLTPGAFANVNLQLGQNTGALMVPSQAIIPQERNKQVIVAQNGKAKFVVVNTETRQASLVEVISGLHSGDTVVTTGILFLKPGADLKFSKIVQ
jgi:membrane fusion protein, multidrug efflux system